MTRGGRPARGPAAAGAWGGGFGQRPRGAGRGEEGLAQPSVVGRLDCGLISENFRGLFENKFERGEWTAGCISRKFKDFYAK